jgi:hypothetical protein
VSGDADVRNELDVLDGPIATFEEGVRQLRALRGGGDSPNGQPGAGTPAPAPPAPAPAPAPSPSPAPVAKDGRYQGGNGKLYVDLRLDAGGSAVVSADVYNNGSTGRQYLASVRSAPGVRIDGPGLQGGASWPAAWQDSTGAVALGSIQVRATAADTITATLRMDKQLAGLQSRKDLVIVAQRSGDELRQLGLEVELEQGVQLPGDVELGGAKHSFRSCLRSAGFAVSDAGSTTTIPTPPGGKWDLSNAYTVLDDLMASTAQASLGAPAWELHALMLGRSSLDGLLGVMFDSGGVLPRQGAAIFVGEIRAKVVAADQDRKIIQTTVHELGHALNLAHRFERVVGRANSTSFMNYDWRYLGGNHRDDFWRSFAFTFDPDELEFLRHGPRQAVMPGTAEFHSINYWADGTGGYSPYVPERPVPGFSLTLTPPPAGTVFAFGAPVFLEVALENKSTQSINFPAQVLDPKAGFLELLVQRRTGAPVHNLADATPFVPIMQRCYDVDLTSADALKPGGRIRNNVNLTYGSGGFAFAEPGEYDITPLLGFGIRNEQGDPEEAVIRGEPLRIRIAYPHTDGEEHDAQTLFRPDVGAWFALGGSDCLAYAGEALEEVRQRRVAERGDSDPVVAAITRAAGIQAGRPSVRFADGEYTAEPGDPEQASRLLNSLDKDALRTFDSHTAEGTKRLAKSYAVPDAI